MKLHNILLLSAIKLSKDDLGELLSQLYLVRAKWYNLGLALGLHSDHLDAIQQQYSAPGDCLREALKLWLSTNPQKGDLIEALKACPVGHESLAYELHGWLPLSPALVQCHNNTSSVQPILESAAEEQKKQPEISAAQEVGG